jgi:hypothetical protein
MSNHINTIEIENFKSIKHLVLEGCKRINPNFAMNPVIIVIY